MSEMDAVQSEMVKDFLNEEPRPEEPSVPAPTEEATPVVEKAEVEVPETPIESEKTPLAESVQKEGIQETESSNKTAEQGDSSELDALRQQNEKLLEMIEKLSGSKVTETLEHSGEGSEGSEGSESSGSKETIPIELGDFDFDEIMESKDSFVKFISNVMSVAKEQAKQEMLTSIPNVVGSFVQRQASMRDVATAFYEKYPELKKVKRYVSTVANEVSAEHPDWTIVQVLDEAAGRAKEVLQLQGVAQSAEKKAAAKPTLPGGSKGSRSTLAPSTGLQKEIDDLISD